MGCGRPLVEMDDAGRQGVGMTNSDEANGESRPPVAPTVAPEMPVPPALPNLAERLPLLSESDTPPTAGRREVELYTRTYSTLLRSSGPIAVDALEQAHRNIQSSLHANASSPLPDMNAFMYSTLRLPPEIVSVSTILLGQSRTMFARHGLAEHLNWASVSAPGRRRRWRWDGGERLVVYVGSQSDLDDLIPTIVAWQIEWNKLHLLLRADEALRERVLAASDESAAAEIDSIREALHIGESDWLRLAVAWGDAFWPTWHRIVAGKRDLRLQLLGGTYLGYSRSARRWWEPVAQAMEAHDLYDRPVYIVSSNLHSLANTLSGTARRRRDALVTFIEQGGHPELLPELQKLQQGDVRASWDNFLYYAARLYHAANAEERTARNQEELERGIITIDGGGALDVGVQLIDLSKVNADDLDPRIHAVAGPMPHSDAVILNINYPLGLAAYHLLGQISAELADLRGVYILGKAATLNARIGDVMISDVIYDEHTSNTYWFNNCFSSTDFAPFLVYGSALDRQRAVTVRGTYLQNRGYLDFYYRENYTVVEMEAGPFLSAVYEDAFLTRHPQGESVTMIEVPVDLGVIHYASDTPYSHAHTLGARGMSYYGMDSTYAATLAIICRIFNRCRTSQEQAPGQLLATAQR